MQGFINKQFRYLDFGNLKYIYIDLRISCIDKKWRKPVPLNLSVSDKVAGTDVMASDGHRETTLRISVGNIGEIVSMYPRNIAFVQPEAAHTITRTYTPVPMCKKKISNIRSRDYR